MSTTLKEVPGWYVEFQAALLRQAPRPGEIDQVTAEGWTKNQKGLKTNLAGCLLPPVAEPTRNWREQDGVIYLSVTSDGTTGPEWIDRLEGKGFRLSDYAKRVLRSPDFKPTSSVTTEIAILKGKLFKDNDRITKKIRAEADKYKFSKPNAEVACLIRETFSNEEINAMGLWLIVAMHEPIKDSNGVSDLLGASRGGDGHRVLRTYSDITDFKWCRDEGFAFAVSQS